MLTVLSLCTEAFNRILNRLPEGDRVRIQNPYEKTSFFIRNTLKIFAGYFHTILLASLGLWVGLRQDCIPEFLHEYILAIGGRSPFFFLGVGLLAALMTINNFFIWPNHEGCYIYNKTDKCPIVLPAA